VRVLVVGSLPPPECARTEALRTEVIGLLAEGHTVEVVAPDAVAVAHRYMTTAGIPGCVRLATMVSGFDSVVLQLQPGLPVRVGAGRWERDLSLVALSFALRRGRKVVIRLENLADLSADPGGRAALLVWRRAERIVFGDEDQQAAFVAALGRPVERLVMGSSRTHGAQEVDADDSGWGDGANASTESILELVRKRAARERRALPESESTHFAGWDRLARPGIALTDLDSDLWSSTAVPRTPGNLARAVLATADRRPLFRPAVRAARVAYRSAAAVFRQGQSG